MNPRYQKMMRRTGKRYVRVAPIGVSLGNTSNWHKPKTVWQTHEGKPFIKRCLLVLKDWFRV